MPAAAYAFAAAPWHFDFTEHQCPHDAWVERLLLEEQPSVDAGRARTLAIHVTLLGAYHDLLLLLSYKGVRSYQLTTPHGYEMRPYAVGHGDWLVDEVRLSENGLVLHEVKFSRGSRWVIECEDLAYTWEARAAAG
jgi:hypothetical protein